MHFLNFFGFLCLEFQLQLLQIGQKTVNADIFPECQILTTTGVFIESERGCSWFIFCNGDDSFMDECEKDYYFNQLYQTCDPKAMVDCRFDNVTTSTTTATTLRPTTTTTLRPTTTTNLRPTSTTTSTKMPTAILTTNGAGGGTSTSASSMVTTTSTTITPTTTTSSNTIVIQCPLFDNPFRLSFMAHPKSCSDYFMCYHGRQIPMHCSAMLHFNVRTGKCDYPENVRCLADLSVIREQCQSHTTDFYPHPDNCNYYYYCKNGYLMLQQCPFFYGWDYERRACVMRGQAKCYKNLLQQQKQTSHIL